MNFNYLLSPFLHDDDSSGEVPNVAEYVEEATAAETKSLPRCNYADETTSFACRCIQQDASDYIWVIWEGCHRRSRHRIPKTLTSLLLAVILSIIKWTFSCPFRCHVRCVRMSVYMSCSTLLLSIPPAFLLTTSTPFSLCNIDRVQHQQQLNRLHHLDQLSTHT